MKADIHISFLSCKNKTQKTSSMFEEEKGLINDSALIIGNPLDCGLKDILFFPVGCSYEPERFKEKETNFAQITNISFAVNVADNSVYDKYANAEYTNDYVDRQDIRNILFYNQITTKSFPLFDSVAHILSFAIHEEFKNKLILYRIVLKDKNQDSIYDGKDAIVLFCSNLEGKELTQLSPSNEQFEQYFYYPKTNKILIKTKIDSDINDEFDSSDETNFREVDILNPQMGIEIFDANTKESLRKNMGIK